MTVSVGRPRGRPPLNGPRFVVYRCVYCKTRVRDRMRLPAHEAQCPMRASMRQMWMVQIDRGKRKLGHAAD